MADINQVQLPDGSQYNITDTTSGYATQSYVQSAISGITKATIGLGNVDNTSDANKPVSTAQQTALDAKTNTSVIAYTEASTTATKRYEIGDQFILNGVLYTATAIIANGGTITVGTNCTASDTIIEQLANIGGSADNITFDNTGTDLVSENVEGAIVEVNAKGTPRTDIAYVESGTTASQAYSVGQLVYVQGTLCKVITAIASGETFTVGTNIELTSISDDINNKEWITSGSIKYRVSGAVVYVSGSLSAGSASTWALLGTLPVGLRPAETCYYCVFYNSAASSYATIAVSASGSVQVIKQTSSAINFQVSFVVG